MGHISERRGINMGDPVQKKKRLNRMRNTHRIVERRRRIINRIWGNSSHIFFIEELYCDGQLRKFNLRCGCRQCKYSRLRFKDKGFRKANNLILRSFNQ